MTRDPTNGDLKADLPVMVFVYGGAFYLGTQLKMDAARLGHVDDVVMVAVNYRVGTIGKKEPSRKYINFAPLGTHFTDSKRETFMQ